MTASWEDIFPSSPIAGETAATVELVGSDWRSDEDWERFKAACHWVATDVYEPPPPNHTTMGRSYRVVNPNAVRAELSNEYGLTIEPRRYSAFWHRASKGKDAFLVADGWVQNTDHKSGNAGKPLRRYRLRDSS
jgi:hypothetical protein